MKILKVMEIVIEMLFPQRCPCCDELLDEEEKKWGFCKRCRKKRHLVSGNFCLKCGKQLVKEQQEYCGDCKKTEHSFREGRGVYVYDNTMRPAMYRFKYGNRRCYGRIFAADAKKRWGIWLSRVQPDVICPVPMYERKKRKRGYNQARVWAAALGKELDLPVDEAALRRVRGTRPQKELNPAARAANLRDAFWVDPVRVRGKRILLADDIYTTGATADEASEKLMKAGAREVFVFCICTGAEG